MTETIICAKIISVEGLYAKKPPLRGWFFGYAYDTIYEKEAHRMSETIICTIITAVAGIMGSYAAVQKGRRDGEIKDAVREQKQADRLEAIEHRLDIHNGYAEKLGSIGEALVAMKKDIEFLKGKKS